MYESPITVIAKEAQHRFEGNVWKGDVEVLNGNRTQRMSILRTPGSHRRYRMGVQENGIRHSQEIRGGVLEMSFTHTGIQHR